MPKEIIKQNLLNLQKCDVNGEKELPLFKWLKSKKGFAGFDPKHKITLILNYLLSKADHDFAKNLIINGTSLNS